MSLRIGFDLDGVLADLDSALAEIGRRLFGPDPDGVRAGAQDPGAADVPAGDPPPPDAALTRDQWRQVWDTVRRTANFWEALPEPEPGIVARLASLAAAGRWEVIFLTQRPPSRGDITQLQSQRWLARHGFEFPSVFVLDERLSRGKVAAALGLDVVVDDRPENCLDVKTESTARAILVWRDAAAAPPSNSQNLGIEIVSSAAECLDLLDAPPPGPSSLAGRLKRFLTR